MISGYLSAEEMAEKWGVSTRYVQNLCKNGRIDGAEKFGKVWAIPENVEKPVDKRIKTGSYIGWKKNNSKKERMG